MSPFRLAALCGAGAALLSAVGPLLRTQAGPQGASIGPNPTARVDAAPVFVPVQDPRRASVRYLLVGGPTPAVVQDDGFAMCLQRFADDAHGAMVGATVAFRFGGAAAAIEPIGDRGAPVRLLRGDGVVAREGESTSMLRMRGCAEAVDVVLRADPESGRLGVLAYDLMVAEPVALRSFEITVEGARSMHVTKDGGLAIDVVLGDGREVTLLQRAPRTFVHRGAIDTPIASRVVLRSANRFGFEVDGAQDGDALCVDPGFLWSTYLGGGASDEAHCVHRLADGDLLIGGWAGSADFPTTPGAFRVQGARDAFLACVSADGHTLRWSTYLGGSDAEEIDSIDVAADGTIVVGGWTGSNDFPSTAGAYQRFFFGGGLLAGIGDGFVARLRADGSALVWASYLGRFGDDFVRRVLVDRDGSIVVAGDTTADRFPTTPGVVQEVFGSGNVFLPDAFVCRMSGDGRSLIWSTFFGGFAQDYLGGLAITSSGNIVIGGLTASSGLPVTSGALQSTLRGFWDGFIATLSPDARHVEACTFLGGEGYEQVKDLVVDASGDVVCVGRIGGDLATFPVTNGAFQTDPGGEYDGFVARISADARTLRAASLLGGAGDDDALGVTILQGGGVVVVGSTAGAGFPVGGNAAQPIFGGGVSDGFVAQLDPTLSMARAVSYAGGADKDTLRGVVTTGVGDECVAVGSTFSTDLPVAANALQPQNHGESDAVVLRVDARTDSSAALALDGPLALRGERSFAPGTAIDACAFRLRNLAPHAVDVDAITVMVGGAGDAARDLGGLSLWIDRDQDGRVSSGDLRLGAPVAAVRAVDRVSLPCARRLAIGEELPLVVQFETAAGCPSGAEFVAAIEGPTAILAHDVDDGRRMLVGGLTSLIGSARISVGRRTFRGDLDGDASIDVRDLRLLASRIGEAPTRDDEDPDTDGTISRDDVEMLIARVLVGAPLAVPPRTVDAGAPMALTGFDLATVDLHCAIDGVDLVHVAASPRAHLFAVPATIPAGRRTLRVTVALDTRFEVPIEVR